MDNITKDIAGTMGLKLCFFVAEKESDCDICGKAPIGKNIWVRMVGRYEGSSPEAEFYNFYTCESCVLKEYKKL